MRHPSRRSPHSPLPRVMIAAFAVVLLGLLVLGCLTLEPVRARIWQARGEQCGTIAFNMGGDPVQDPTLAHQRAECLATAWVRCQAAAMTYTDPFLDGSTTYTFVVERGVGPWQSCALAYMWDTRLAGGGGGGGVKHCAALEVRASELLVRACGAQENVTVPFDRLR